MVAALLTPEAKGLLIGERADPRRIVGSWTVLDRCCDVAAIMHLASGANLADAGPKPALGRICIHPRVPHHGNGEFRGRHGE